MILVIALQTKIVWKSHVIFVFSGIHKLYFESVPANKNHYGSWPYPGVRICAFCHFFCCAEFHSSVSSNHSCGLLAETSMPQIHALGSICIARSATSNENRDIVIWLHFQFAEGCVHSHICLAIRFQLRRYHKKPWSVFSWCNIYWVYSTELQETCLPANLYCYSLLWNDSGSYRGWHHGCGHYKVKLCLVRNPKINGSRAGIATRQLAVSKFVCVFLGHTW
jgi:hypothetical protein